MPTNVAERQWLITVSGVPGVFGTKSGGVLTVEHTRDFDGGSLTPKIYQGPPQISDMTVSRAYEVPRDTDVARQLRAVLAGGRRFEATINATPLDESMVPVGPAEVYEAVLSGVNAPEGNANSSQTSRLELTFSVRAVR